MKRMKCVRGDITELKVDAIVNAANSSLMGGGGVDGAIHRAGGDQILEECMAIRKRQGGCPTGEAVITTAGNLQASFVIHTVGPIWNNHDGQEDDLLRSAYRNSLLLAVANSVRTIAFPNISTGVYRFPKQRAAEIAVREVSEFLVTDQTLTDVIFCCFDTENESIYQKLLEETN
jgi:O-acetyl-ADP-ribose deacetylase (regulator of RNase III)